TPTRARTRAPSLLRARGAAGRARRATRQLSGRAEAAEPPSRGILPCDGSARDRVGLVRVEAGAKGGNHGGSRCDPFCLERGLEIGHDPRAGSGVCFRAGDERTDLGTGLRQLLSRQDPPQRGRWEKPQQRRDSLFVVAGHLRLDATPAHDLPSRTALTFARQRYILLTIV